MRHTLQSEWPAFEAAHDTAAPVSIRVNAAKGVKPSPTLEPIPWCSTGYYLDKRPSFTLDPLFHAGCYYVQEPSSMFLEQALKTHAPLSDKLRVLDLCAAPGGKSTHLLSLLSPESLLVSNEVIRTRTGILRENIQKWGAHNTVVTNSDPQAFSSLTGFFDIIVVDAPCSGEGLFRKDPASMEQWSQDNVTLCSQRQRRVLNDVWPALKEGGLLIYSTCTYNEDEDEKILSYLSEEYNPEFLPIDVTEGIEQIDKNGIIGYRFYPHRIKGEGFFLAAMRKTEAESSLQIKPSKNRFDQPDKKSAAQVREWITRDDQRLILREDLIQSLPDSHAEAILFLTQHLNVAYAGTFLARVKQNKLIPEHALALSTILKKDAFTSFELDEEAALRYLRKDAFNLDANYKGFALATFKNIPLGWMNVLPGRVNNLYPAEWRIRML